MSGIRSADNKRDLFCFFLSKRKVRDRFQVQTQQLRRQDSGHGGIIKLICN